VEPLQYAFILRDELALAAANGETTAGQAAGEDAKRGGIDFEMNPVVLEATGLFTGSGNPCASITSLKNSGYLKNSSCFQRNRNSNTRTSLKVQPG
jgi:hypothetical protein